MPRANDRQRPLYASVIACGFLYYAWCSNTIAQGVGGGAQTSNRTMIQGTTSRAARYAFVSAISGDWGALDDARRAFSFARDRKAHALVTGERGSSVRTAQTRC